MFSKENVNNRRCFSQQYRPTDRVKENFGLTFLSWKLLIKIMFIVKYKTLNLKKKQDTLILTIGYNKIFNKKHIKILFFQKFTQNDDTTPQFKIFCQFHSSFFRFNQQLFRVEQDQSACITFPHAPN